MQFPTVAFISLLAPFDNPPYGDPTVCRPSRLKAGKLYVPFARNELLCYVCAPFHHQGLNHEIAERDRFLSLTHETADVLNVKL